MTMSWQEKTRAPSHADDWLITYADMITLLLCFFVLFLVVTLAKEKTLRQAEARPVPVEMKEVERLNAFPVVAPAVELLPEAGLQGDRIVILDIDSAAFFESGSADLKEAGRALLKGVAARLKGAEYEDYGITVEGHTDDTPIETARFPSNWELSSARASSVVRFLAEEGLSSQKLRAVGYADTKPKAPNRDRDGNAISFNQAENRRVVIKLEKIEKAQ